MASRQEPLRGTIERRQTPAFGQLRTIENKDLHRVFQMDGNRVALVLRDGLTVVIARSVIGLACDIVGRPSPLDPIDAAIVDASQVGRL